MKKNNIVELGKEEKNNFALRKQSIESLFENKEKNDLVLLPS